MIVVDANILIRAVLGRRARQLIETYGDRGFRFFTADAAFQDAEKYLPHLIAKRGHSANDALLALEYLRGRVETLASDIYSLFEDEARVRLRTRDEEDWPILAAALALACPIWTEDEDFFGCGVATWTTSRVEILLKQTVEPMAPEK